MIDKIVHKVYKIVHTIKVRYPKGISISWGYIFSYIKFFKAVKWQFAAKVGLSKAVVSKYENGLGFPTFDALIQIAEYFGVTTDFLPGVAKSKTIDVSSLTDTQVDTIHKIISEFNKECCAFYLKEMHRDDYEGLISIDDISLLLAEWKNAC